MAKSLNRPKILFNEYDLNMYYLIQLSKYLKFESIDIKLVTIYFLINYLKEFHSRCSKKCISSKKRSLLDHKKF